MKKLFILSILLAQILVSFGQATPVAEKRVPLRSTVFTSNLPAGTTIKCMADSTSWDVGAAGVAGTFSINTAWVAGTITLKKTDLSINRTSTTAVIRSNYGHGNVGSSATIGAATTDSAGLLVAADKVKLDGLSAGAGTMLSFSFVATIDSITPPTTIVLPFVTKDTTSFVLSMNGVELKHDATRRDYAVTSVGATHIHLYIPRYKYDEFVVTYLK